MVSPTLRAGGEHQMTNGIDVVRVPLLVIGSILCLVVGSLIATAPALAAATIPPPKLSALIPPSEQVTSVTSVRLTPTGPNQEIVKTVHVVSAWRPRLLEDAVLL